MGQSLLPPAVPEAVTPDTSILCLATLLPALAQFQPIHHAPALSTSYFLHPPTLNYRLLALGLDGPFLNEDQQRESVLSPGLSLSGPSLLGVERTPVLVKRSRS